MKKIFNATQHAATKEEVKAGVMPGDPSDEVKSLITFTSAPSQIEMTERAVKLANIISFAGCDQAMIGGAPYFMSTLETILKKDGIQPVYAFTQRKVIEKTLPDGSVSKTAVFEFEGWVEA